MFQHGDANESRGGEHHRPVRQIAQCDQGGFAPHHDSGVAKPDDDQEEPDARSDRQLLRAGNGVHHPLPHRQHGQDEHQDAGAEDGAQRGLPGKPQRAHRDSGEVGVQSHPRRQRDRVVGVESHDRRPERCREAGRHQHGTGIHPRLPQHQRIHENDVRHRQEGGAAGQHLRPHG